MNPVRYVYAVKHKDEDIRMASRSGGIFTAISDIVLDNGGVVYGCALDGDFLAYHTRACTKEERDAFRGSKYIQSRMGDCMRDVGNDLKDGKTVLFSGTPCQNDGLRNYLEIKKIPCDNLLTLEILCHGVPSPRVWSDFLNWKSDGREISSVDFRNKKSFGWEKHIETVVTDGEEVASENFSKLFYSHYILRPSCFECRYKRENRFSDITIGDYWHIGELDSGFHDNKGVSLVMLNTEKGKAYFEKCSDDIITERFPLALSYQPALQKNYTSPAKREQFWNDYNSMTFGEMIEKYQSPPPKSLKRKVLDAVLSVMKKVMSLGR